MRTERWGISASPGRAAAGLVIMAMGLIFSSGNVVAAVGDATEYPTPTGGTPRGIAAGPDGNLWFTEENLNKVASVTTSGVFTEYPIPTANSGPYDIAAGPDGNLWFTEESVSQVAKVTTSGVFTEYPIPTASTIPRDITAGPDGNLWFTEVSSTSLPSSVAKVTTS